jgi:DNA-binding Lrp family transcriptional regulator
MEYVHHDLEPLDQKMLEWRTGIYGKTIKSVNEIAERLKLSPAAVSQRAARIARLIAKGKESLA